MKKNLLRAHLFWQNFRFCVSTTVHEDESSVHRHDDFFELVFAFKGRAVHVADHCPRNVSAGSIFLIRPGIEHLYRDAQSFGIYNILFSKSFLRYFQQDMFSYPNFQFLFGEPAAGSAARTNDVLRLPDTLFPEIIRLLDDILKEQRIGGNGGQTAILSDALRLILLIVRSAVMDFPGRNPSRAFRISGLMTELDGRCSEKWTLRKMASSARMSVGNFRIQFKQQTGISPIAYLLELRLRRAASMLTLPDSSVSGVALLCGFEDSNYFSRQFRAFFRTSPRDFRRRILREE